MIEKRSSAASCNTPNGMFVTGGFSSSLLSSTEYFSGQWTKGPDLPEAMHAHCQVYTSSGVIVTGTVHFHTHLLINNYILTGGRTSSSYSLATVWRLDGNIWNTLPSMNQARTRHSCEYYREQVVVMGGIADAGMSVEILNIDTLEWTRGPSLPRKVYNGLSIIYADVL